MPRPLACALVLLAASFAPAAEPVHRALAVQAAMAAARDHLAANRPADAVAALEPQLPYLDGNRAFLDLLRAAYAAELPAAGPARAADLRTKLALLGAPAAEPTVVASPPAKPAAAAGVNVLAEAAALFNQATAEPRKFGLAAKLFAAAFADHVEMSPEQLAAWAYCRIRVANDRLAQPDADGPALAAEVEQAMALAPAHAKLQEVGRDVLAAARRRPGAASPSPATGDVAETASFRVVAAGNKPLADAVAKAAEGVREAVFARWSGPAGGPWAPKCEITIHPTAAGFASATGLSPAATGKATVQLEAGRAVARRLALRADDPTLTADALPREVTILVLADLFPSAAPPVWAEAGMAVLASSPPEVDRYLRTAARVYRDGKLPAAAQVLAGPGSADPTGYYAASVALVDFLVKWKGERAFVLFLRDAQRYGVSAALSRTYGVADAKRLDDEWARAALSVTRGQADR